MEMEKAKRKPRKPSNSSREERKRKFSNKCVTLKSNELEKTSSKKKISMKKIPGLKKTIRSSKYVTAIAENLNTPIATINFCNISKPHYFSGSHIPRYRVSMLFDPKKDKHKKFLEILEKFAVENDIDTVGRMTEEGLVLINYQGRERPKTFLVEYGEKTPVELDLDHDLPRGFSCVVFFDLKQYFDKYAKKNAFTYSPIKVIFYLDKETQKLIEVSDGNS